MSVIQLDHISIKTITVREFYEKIETKSKTKNLRDVWFLFINWKTNCKNFFSKVLPITGLVIFPPSPYNQKSPFFFYSGKNSFSNFSNMFLNPNIFSNLNSNCSNILYLRNVQEKVKNCSVSKIVLTFHCLNKLF